VDQYAANILEALNWLVFVTEMRLGIMRSEMKLLLAACTILSLIVVTSRQYCIILYGYTLGAAFAGRREKTEGSLEPGKLADLIILSQNIFDIDPHKIGETKVLTTIVGGRVVFQFNEKSAQEKK
jgi:cytosine/adenosine deaminase-related metal-dependent hydrolase